jgi:hypothetical protein
MSHIQYIIGGKGLNGNDLTQLLYKSYEKTPVDHENFKVDPTLSGQRVKVYHNQDTNQVVIAHRGTSDLNDWYTNLRYSLLNDTSSKRFEHSKNIEQQARKKYGPSVNYISIGHSLGAKLAENTSDPNNEVITYNGATTPFDVYKQKTNDNQYNIRTDSDVVSVLKPYIKQSNPIIKLKNPTMLDMVNILGNHSLKPLDELNDDFIGKPIKGKSIRK